LFNTVAASLLVPPVNLFVPTLAGLLLSRWRPVAGRTLAGFGLCALLLLALPATARSLIAALEQDLPLTAPTAYPPAAIVILGGDSSEATQDNDHVDAANRVVGPLSLERERAGAALRRRTGLPVLVTGGQLDRSGPPIAMLMARSLLEDFATPVTWIEVASVTTWENATLSAPMLRAAGIRSVYVVTQAWHMRRALLAFRHAGLIATAAPTQIDSPPTWAAWEFVPRASAWERSYYALHEWIGCAYYALRS